MTHATAKSVGLESVYPVGHRLAERIFWDPKAGSYYDAGTDLFLDDFDPVGQ